MKCSILGPNVKVLARTLHALARVGDDLFIDVMRDKLLLRTVNSTQSAFAEFILLNRFFSFYNLETDNNEESPKCKISMKSFLTVFKTPNSMDRMVDGCELSFKPDDSQLILIIQFSSGSKKTHFLPVIECESLQVKYKKNVPFKITATAKLLAGAVKNFRVNEDEITLSVSPQKTFLKTHVDANIESSKIVHTELCLLAEEFEYYDVGNPLSVTFCLKQLRAVVSFAESTSLPITILFESPGRPVLFCVSNEAIYEGNFVVSSLSTNNMDSQLSSSQDSELSEIQSVRQASNQHSSKRKSPILSNNSLESALKTTIRVPSGEDANVACDSPSREQDLGDENMDFEFECSNECLQKETDFNELNRRGISMNDRCEVDVQNVVRNINYSLINTVFGRCLDVSANLKIQKSRDEVLAYDSEGLEDSE